MHGLLLGASQQTRYVESLLQRYCLIVVVNTMRTEHNLIIYITLAKYAMLSTEATSN